MQAAVHISLHGSVNVTRGFCSVALLASVHCSDGAIVSVLVTGKDRKVATDKKFF